MTNSTPVKIVETVLRDGHQSLAATRMRMEDMIPVLEQLDEVGYHALEAWGGATFDSCLRFLNEDPWDRLRKLRKAHYAGEGQSLTPQQPLDPLELAALLDGHWHIHSQSGVRVFHDYMPVEFQQRAELLDLLEMELAYRRHPTFAGLGRYLHWLCRPL